MANKGAAATTTLGKKGEAQACEALEKAGMKIIARNYRAVFSKQVGEVDIIALDGDTVVFIEVKSWSAFGMENLQYSMGLKKQQKIIKTAKYFINENRKYSNMTIRFDVIFVKINKTQNSQDLADSQIYHLASAFTESVQ